MSKAAEFKNNVEISGNLTVTKDIHLNGKLNMDDTITLYGSYELPNPSTGTSDSVLKINGNGDQLIWSTDRGNGGTGETVNNSNQSFHEILTGAPRHFKITDISNTLFTIDIKWDFENIIPNDVNRYLNFPGLTKKQRTLPAINEIFFNISRTDVSFEDSIIIDDDHDYVLDTKETSGNISEELSYVLSYRSLSLKTSIEDTRVFTINVWGRNESYEPDDYKLVYSDISFTRDIEAVYTSGTSGTDRAGVTITGQLIVEDDDGDVIDYDIHAAPSLGDVSISHTGRWTYNGYEFSFGSDSFTVITSDIKGGTSQVEISIDLQSTYNDISDVSLIGTNLQSVHQNLLPLSYNASIDERNNYTLLYDTADEIFKETTTDQNYGLDGKITGDKYGYKWLAYKVDESILSPEYVPSNMNSTGTAGLNLSFIMRKMFGSTVENDFYNSLSDTNYKNNIRVYIVATNKASGRHFIGRINGKSPGFNAFDPWYSTNNITSTSSITSVANKLGSGALPNSYLQSNIRKNTYSNHSSYSNFNANINGHEPISIYTDSNALQDHYIYFALGSEDREAVIGGDVYGSVNMNEIITGTLTATDKDGDVSFSIIENASNGNTVIDSITGMWTYTPDTNFSGNDAFTARTTDISGGITDRIINILVDSKTTFLGDISGIGDEGEEISGNVGADDIDGKIVSYVVESNPSNGIASIDSSGTWTYTSYTDTSKNDAFTITTTDILGGQTNQVISIHIDTETTFSGDITGSGNQNEDISGNLGATDVDGDIVSYSVITNPIYGDASVNDVGTWTYKPDGGFLGNDIFTIETQDITGQTTVQTVRIFLDTETTFSGTISGFGNAGEEISGNLGASDADGDIVSYSIFINPSHGDASVNNIGTWTYTSQSGFFGDDAFTIRTTDASGGTSIQEINIVIDKEAEFSGDISGLTLVNKDVSGTLIAIDDNQEQFSDISYNISSDASRGSVFINSSGKWTYTPEVNFTGNDVFTVTTTDTNGGTTSFDIPIVVVFIYRLHDITLIGRNMNSVHSNLIPFSYAQATSIQNNYTLQFDASNRILKEFTVHEPLTNRYGLNGQITSDNNGYQWIVYKVDEGEHSPEYVSSRMNTANRAGINLSYIMNKLFGSNLEHDFYNSLSDENYNNNIRVYVVSTNKSTKTNFMAKIDGTSPGFNAFDPWYSTNNITSESSIRELEQGLGSGALPNQYLQSQIRVNTIPTHPAYHNFNTTTSGHEPVAIYTDSNAVEDHFIYFAFGSEESEAVVSGDIYGSGNANEHITGTLVAVDEDGDVSFNILVDASYGRAEIGGVSGLWTYVPNDNFTGDDTFTVQITDVKGGVTKQIINIIVDTEAVITGNINVSMFMDEEASGNLGASDADGGIISYSIKTTPINGTANINSLSGDWNYKPIAGFLGYDSFSVIINDASGGTTESTLSVLVGAVTVISGDTVGFGDINEEITGTLIASDDDGEVVFQISANASNVNATITSSTGSTGDWKYVPNGDFRGSDSFYVKTTDDTGGTKEQIINIYIDAEATFAGDLYGSSDAKEGITGSLNATDLDGSIDDYKISTHPSRGNASVNSVGEWSYVAIDGYHGNDAFTITTTDIKTGKTTVDVNVFIPFIYQINQIGLIGSNMEHVQSNLVSYHEEFNLSTFPDERYDLDGNSDGAGYQWLVYKVEESELSPEYVKSNMNSAGTAGINLSYIMTKLFGLNTENNFYNSLSNPESNDIIVHIVATNKASNTHFMGRVNGEMPNFDELNPWYSNNNITSTSSFVDMGSGIGSGALPDNYLQTQIRENTVSSHSSHTNFNTLVNEHEPISIYTNSNTLKDHYIYFALR